MLLRILNLSNKLLHKICKNKRNNCALYFIASSHFHLRKSFQPYACSGRTSVTHYKHVFAWRPVTSINRSHVLTARAHENFCVNTLISLNMALNIV